MHYIFLFHQASKAHAIAVSDHYIVCGCTDGIIRYENAMTTVYIVEVLLTDTLVCRQLYLWMPLQNPRCFSQLPYKLSITSSYGHPFCVLRVSAHENFHCINTCLWMVDF